MSVNKVNAFCAQSLRPLRESRKIDNLGWGERNQQDATNLLHTLHPALQDGTDRGFRNVGKLQSDAGEIPKRIHTIFKTRRKSEIKKTNLMFIIKLSQHVSGIIMPIIRRTIVCTAAYGVLHWLWWLWLCGAGMRAASQLHTATAITTSAEHHMRQCTLLFSWWWA